MAQHDYDDALRSAIQRTRVEVDGLRVDPWEVVVGAEETALAELASALTLTIGRAFIEREMEQWSLSAKGDLIKTVEESLIQHSGVGMHAYLGMVRGDYRTEDVARKAGLRLLPWLRPRRPRWLWTAWERVSLSGAEQDVLIEGKCVSIRS